MPNKIVMLGAGSSADFGFPLSHEFFSRAYSLLPAAVLSRAEKLMHRVYPDLPEDKARYPRFEEAITAIYEREEFDRHDIDAFTSVVAALFLKVEQSDFFAAKSENYKKFIELLLRKDSDTVFISLNYDLMIDNILDACIQDNLIPAYNYGLSELFYTNGTMFDAEGVSLLKPHGSLNLFYCDVCHKIHYCEDYFFAQGGQSCAYCLYVNKGRTELYPLVLPPIYNKYGYGITNEPGYVGSGKPVGPYVRYRNEIDEVMKNYLSRAQEIVIIGYSMPDHDIDFKGLLNSGLSGNVNRRGVPVRIVAADADKENMKERYSGLAGEVTIEPENGFYKYIESYIEKNK